MELKVPAPPVNIAHKSNQVPLIPNATFGRHIQKSGIMAQTPPCSATK
jgi:hypothetical protein